MEFLDLSRLIGDLFHGGVRALTTVMFTKLLTRDSARPPAEGARVRRARAPKRDSRR
jgi:hypothetical protein